MPLLSFSVKLSDTSRQQGEDQFRTLDGGLLVDAYPSFNAKSIKGIAFGFLRED
jgi:hypothetical protein